MRYYINDYNNIGYGYYREEIIRESTDKNYCITVDFSIDRDGTQLKRYWLYDNNTDVHCFYNLPSVYKAFDAFVKGDF
jgi:hypothetical protein